MMFGWMTTDIEFPEFDEEEFKRDIYEHAIIKHFVGLLSEKQH